MGPVHAECPVSIHTPPFGNWGVTSNFGQKFNGHQFQGWCHDSPTCDNDGNCTTSCRDGWYEWNSCTDIPRYAPPNCSLYNAESCTQQVTTTGANVHGVRRSDAAARCPTDSNGDGIADQGGCSDLRTHATGANFLSLYELDPGTADELVQTVYFPEVVFNLDCDVWGCRTPLQSEWLTPIGYDSPTSPAKVFAEMAARLDSVAFVDTSGSCRAVAPNMTTVSAASFRGPAVAPDSIASVFGRGLAAGIASATTLPLPIRLEGTQILITDSTGAVRSTPLFYVSPDQVNLLIPADTAIGPAKLTLRRDDSTTASGTLEVAPTAPGLFAASAGGTGVAAATAFRVNAAGQRVDVPVFECSSTVACTPVPISLGTSSDAVYLTLYGTGIRRAGSQTSVAVGGVPAPVLYAGPQTQYVGLDQVNVSIPQALRGRGLVNVVVAQGAVESNAVTIRVE